MKNFRDYLSESEEAATNPVAGDTFAINIREECLIESVVVESRDDGVVIAADDRMIELLESYGYTFEENCMECGMHECGCGDPAAYSDDDEPDAGQNPGEYDQEGDMAKDELLTVIRSARKLIGMLDNDDNMPEWTQKKITKSADYVDTAADYIASQKERGVMEEDVAEGYKEERLKGCKCQHRQGDNKKCPIHGVQEGVAEGSGETSPVARATLHRIMMRHPGMLAQHGPERVMKAVDDVADLVGDMDDIGSSDVSGWVNMVQEILDSLDQGVAEVSNDTLTSYLTKLDRDNLKHKMDPTKRSDSKRMKSGPNFVKAFTKLDNRKQGVAEARITNSRVNEIRQLSKEFFGKEPYSSARISGGKVLRLSFPIWGYIEGHYRYVPKTAISPEDQQRLKNLKSKFDKFMASNGVGADEVTMQFHIGSGVYAGIRIAIPQEQGVAEGPVGGEINDTWMNDRHKEFYKKNPHFKRNDRDRVEVGHGTQLATRVDPAVKPAQIKKKPATPFGITEAATMASVSKLLRHIERHHPTWFDDYGMGEVEDTVVDMAEQGTFSGMTVVNAAALVGQELESMYGADAMSEAEYQGRKVQLGKKMKGDVKKSKVYVKNPQGNVVKVNFGDPNMKIRKSNPGARKSFRARHNCDNPGPRHKARYWSCRAW